MTRKELQKSLSKIGWKIDKSGNGLNDFIINHKGEVTSFVLIGNKIEIRTELFGSSFKGDFVIEIGKLKIREIRTIPRGLVDGISIAIKKGVFISFYNHDIKKNKK